MGAIAYLLVPLLAVAAAFFYLSPLPFSVDVGTWEPQPLPELVGVLAPNTLLDSCTHLGKVNGAETLAVGPDGRLYGGTADGWIVAVNPTSGEVEKWANIRGRPLGLEFDKEGDLIVADGLKGLLHVNATTKRITILAHDAGGKDIVFADDVAIAEDGTIYFSDATSIPPVQKGCGYDALAGSLIDILSSKARGRLIRYSADKGAEVLLEHIYFANGVALAKDESFVLVVETPRSRVLRYWLKGPKAGTSDVFVDGLPGMADGVSRRTDGSDHFWLPLVSSRDPFIEFIAPYPFIRAALLKIGIPVVEKHHGHVLELDESGNIVRSLEGTTASLTAVTELEGKLYLGHLHAPHITVFDLKRL